MKYRLLSIGLFASLIFVIGLSACDVLNREADGEITESLQDTWERKSADGILTTWTFGDESLLTIHAPVTEGHTTWHPDPVYYYYVDETGRTLTIREASFCGINGSITYRIKECSQKRLVLSSGETGSVGYNGTMFDDWERDITFTRK